ncbi:MAG: single-stranded DNA-binding protein [Microlunatus sp.]
MAGETSITLIGNLTADPELRFTPSGAPVANFTVASTPRTFDRQSGEWRDGDAMFLNCAVWRQYAENVAESLQKGMRVIVQGRLKSRSYETREGERRTVFEVDVEEIGPALRYATAKVTRTSGGGGGGFGGGNSGGGFGGGGGYGGNQGQGGQGGGGRQGGYGNDPWTSGGNAGGGQSGPAPGNQGSGGQGNQGGDPWGAAPSDEPPF